MLGARLQQRNVTLALAVLAVLIVVIMVRRRRSRPAVEVSRPLEGDELIDLREAATILEVTPDRVDVMVDQGMLEPVASRRGPRFRRTEVEAVRLAGA
ncbi:hypothetical protein [Rhabdothermincola sediminis]|uniref:hypothetical protein n=1 Tax=Rhabdothermincola sediminis TaxID=2751370 RepID=UPI001AA054B0|nr:hypothetical protein [Rhabdothermincola sediminis]